MKWLSGISVILLIGLFLNFQNCSGASFSISTQESANGGGDNGTSDPGNGAVDDPNDPGLDGGHFDLDTSSRIYSLGEGDTDHHVHEYDDKYDISQVDFFNMIDTKFTSLSSQVGATQSFVIIVANAQLSAGAILEINGTSYPIISYQQKVEDFRNGAPTLATFTLSGNNPLTSFKLKFKPDAITSGGLIPTQTGCVVGNDPGINGEYRNGALTIQILDASIASINPLTKTAAAGLLWEATVFWHKDGAGCYGDVQ